VLRHGTLTGDEIAGLTDGVRRVLRWKHRAVGLDDPVFLRPTAVTRETEKAGLARATRRRH